MFANRMKTKPTPRPSRKGVYIKPSKGGRTVQLGGRFTPAEIESIHKAHGDKSFADWVAECAKKEST